MSDDYRARLIAARKKVCLSRRQMAAKLLTPHVTYEQWEAGARRTPGVAVLAAEAVARIRPPKTGAIRNPAAATIRRLADGRRTPAEVAAAAGIGVSRVYQAAHVARKAGRPLKFARSASRNSAAAAIRKLADGRRTAAEVAAAAGISVSRVYQAAHVARKVGRPLKFVRSAHRNSATATIRRLADGTRTTAEVAAAAGVGVAHVYQVASAEKKAGRPVTFAPSTRGWAPQTRRNADIADAIREGSTLAAQAAIYGITRQAVHQIAIRHGVRASALRRKERTTRARLVQEQKNKSKQERLRKKQGREKQLIDMKLSGLTYKEISARAGLGIGRLIKIFKENHVSRPHVKRDLATRTMIARRWRDGEDAEQLADEFGTTAGYVTVLANRLGFHRRAASSRQNVASK